jgi:purine-binding chemotaxis protein CheW
MANEAQDRGGFDWQRVYMRLDAAQAALERKFMPGEEVRREVLRARAKLLAREPQPGEAAGKSLDIVEFLLGYEHYGIESAYIREVCPLKDLRPLPGTPHFVLGLIAQRGQILSVIDLRRLFDLPEKGLTDLSRVLIVRAGQVEVGVLADAILPVRSIALSDLQPALTTMTGIGADYVKGISKDALVVLEIEKFLSDRRTIVDEG